MTADSGKMREAANEVTAEQKSYNAAVQEIDSLITTTLGQYWGDEAYDELKAKYIEKHRGMLEELGRVIGEFSSNLTEAADDLDKTINSLR